MKLYVCWGHVPGALANGRLRAGTRPARCERPATTRTSCSRTGCAVVRRGGQPLLGRDAARRLTGKSTVPVLEFDDGTAIWDSKRIVEWAWANPLRRGAHHERIDDHLRSWIGR